MILETAKTVEELARRIDSHGKNIKRLIQKRDGEISTSWEPEQLQERIDVRLRDLKATVDQLQSIIN